jgi:sarcosine oxidase subunit delta
MTFLIPCPDCGPREVTEFSFGGESGRRPGPDEPVAALARYLYVRRNVSGEQEEWWFHRDGCRAWLVARRDTRSNTISSAVRPVERTPAAP